MEALIPVGNKTYPPLRRNYRRAGWQTQAWVVGSTPRAMQASRQRDANVHARMFDSLWLGALRWARARGKHSLEQRAGTEESREDWARIWFAQLARFHQGDLQGNARPRRFRRLC